MTDSMYANDPRRHPLRWLEFVKLAPKLGLVIDKDQPNEWLRCWNWYLEGHRMGQEYSEKARVDDM